MIISLFSCGSAKTEYKATFFYGCSRGHSGQRFASEMLVTGLRQRGWQIRVVTTPLLDRIGEYRSEKRIAKTLMLGLRLIVAWLKGLWIALRPGILYVSLGQTRWALLRDGFPLLIRRLFPRQTGTVISLNGNVFMGWHDHTLEAKLLRHMAHAARYVTVVGPNQQRRLREIGIMADKPVHVDNACLIPPITEQDCLDKHEWVVTARPLNVLYLSNLIETKGYPEFVEAVSRLATSVSVPIKATLCGNVRAERHTASRFVTPKAAKCWVKEQVARINRSPWVRLQWIDGAVGEAKTQLFRDAHVFILPSRYKVEAQPIVILEALASGCVVITTKVGEIPATVSHQTALLLDETSPQTIAEALVDLHHHPEKRLRLALNGLKLFTERFAYAKHLDRWEQLLVSLQPGG
jgi:glycosyltransferase involved in cell wall biosynthesis